MSKRLKRYKAPKSWPIPRKIAVWAVKPRAGPHPMERSLPLLIIIRDILGYGDTAKEAKHIIGKGEILVDRRVAKDYKMPVGLMDTISIPKIDEHYRMLIDSRGKLKLVKIDEERSKWKLVRIENKTTVKGGKIQLNLHDGRNILLNENKYKTGDVLKIELPSQKILKDYPLKENHIAMIIGGKHVGEISAIKDYEVTRSPKPNIVNFQDEFSTIKDYVFIIGINIPEITLPEVSAL